MNRTQMESFRDKLRPFYYGLHALQFLPGATGYSLSRAEAPGRQIVIMQILDFARSFILFRVDVVNKPPVTVTHKPPFTVNNARVPIESHCRILDRETGLTHSFNLGASCKTERVNVERDIWTEPNADFMPLVSDTQFMTVKTFDHAGRRIRLFRRSSATSPSARLSISTRPSMICASRTPESTPLRWKRPTM